jgi:hypothetical protein
MSKFSVTPFPGANKYLHIDQINFVKTRIKLCYFAKKKKSFAKVALLKNQLGLTVHKVYFCFWPISLFLALKNQWRCPDTCVKEHFSGFFFFINLGLKRAIDRNGQL